MQSLVNVADSKLMLRLEAARVTYEVLSLSYRELKSTLKKVDAARPDLSTAVLCLRDSWSFVDSSHRYATLVSQIRGFKHKDPRYKRAEVVAGSVLQQRNFIQHLNSAIPESRDDIYPISGAISWPSEDRQASFTFSLGRLPAGSQFHSLSFNFVQSAFSPNVRFHVDRHQLDMCEAMQAFTRCHEYLKEWLSENKMLSDELMTPTFMAVNGPVNAQPPSSMWFMRVKYQAN